MRRVVFSPDGHTLMTVSWDNTAKLWDVAPTDWSAGDVESFAQLASSSRIDEAGEVQPLDTDEITRLLNIFKSRSGR